MAVTIFGINHRCTNLEQLEELTFSAEEIMAALLVLSAKDGVEECVLISTCNRLEFYTVCQDEVPVQQYVRHVIKSVKPACEEESLDMFYYKEGHAAIQHLFAVSSGLDSLVIGENEIAGQVKEAYKIACQQNTNGMLTNKLFHAAFRASKRVKNETKLNAGNCSVGSVAVDMAEDLFPDIQSCTVLLIGAGQIGEVVAKNFAKRKVKGLIIANRSVEKAEHLTEEVGGIAIPLNKIYEYLGQANIIVSGTGSPEYLLCYHDMEKLLQQQPSKRLLMVDIALPRDFDPKIGTLPNIMLKNLYDLQEIVERNLEKRGQEIPKAKAILEEEVQKFLEWKDSLKLNSTIKALNHHFEAIRLRELEKYQRQFPAEMFQQVALFTKSLTQKYIHLLVSNIKSLHGVCELDSRQIHILEHVFDSHEISEEQTHCGVKR